MDGIDTCMDCRQMLLRVAQVQELRGMEVLPVVMGQLKRSLIPFVSDAGSGVTESDHGPSKPFKRLKRITRK